MLRFDLFGKLLDRFFPGGRDVLGVALGKEGQKIDQVSIWQMKVEDSGTAAGAVAFGPHADFPHPTAAFKHVAFGGQSGESLLEFGIVIVAYQFRDQGGEPGRFDEGDHRFKV
jgi:hypothetical protein